jgi:COMPASS component BRE2
MREPTPAPPISSIPQKRALEEDHSPVVSSPLNPEVKPAELQAAEEAPNVSRAKSGRPKKETFKKREARGGESARATPDPRGAKDKDKDKDKDKEPDQPKSSPLRYKLAPPKSSDFEPPRGPLLLPHHEVTNANGQTIEFFETSDQCVS